MMLEKFDASSFRRICHTAVSRSSFTRGDVIFCAGDVPQFARMNFVVDGHLKYSQYGDLPTETRQASVAKNTWLGEPVLYTQWAHVGDLVTMTESSFVHLHAAAFQDFVSKMPS